VRVRPIVPKALDGKEYSDAPMEGWKERGAEELPAHVVDAARLGRERLTGARAAQRRADSALASQALTKPAGEPAPGLERRRGPAENP